MKKPIDLLCARHQASVPRLDAIRREVLAGHQASAGREAVEVPAGIFTHLWMELIWPCRHAWAVVAAIWILLFIVNFAQQDNSPTVLAKAPQSTEMIIALHRQEEKLNELLTDQPSPAEALPSPNFTPKPRSETSGIISV